MVLNLHQLKEFVSTENGKIARRKSLKPLKITESNDNVTKCNADVQNSNTEKEIELEIEKDIITEF